MSHAQQTLNAPPETERPPYRMAAAVFLGALVLYVITLAPTTQFWDTSEYIAAAYTLGIPHPPGNPFFVLVAHVWGLIPWAAGYAQRINLLAAVTSAASAGCWFLIGERWLRNIVPVVWPRRLAALAGALVAATAFTVWNQSVVNEKVYTLSLLSIALILWLIVRWDDQPAGEAHDHYLLLIAYLLALTATNHMMGVLVGPVVMVLLFPPLKKHRGRTEDERRIEWSQFLLFSAVWALLIALGLEGTTPIYAAAVLYLAALAFAIFHARNWQFGLALLGVAAVGLSVYIFLPIRAAHFPAINEGEPTNWQALWEVLTRQQYGKPSIIDNPMYPPGPSNPGHTLELYGQQIANYWQYFKWQFGHDWPARVQAGLAVLFGLTGLLGAIRHWLADRRTAIAMTLLVFTFTFALIFYLNFKWGFSQTFSEPGLQHEVRERDYFFICSFAIWGIWVGMGLATFMEMVQDWFRPRQPDDRLRWAVATPLLALFAFIPLLGNRLTASRAGETIARDFAYDLLQTVEPYGVLVTAGDNDTFPLWYAQEVEGIRRDVTVVNLSLANTDWYLRQMQRRPIETYDPAAGPAIYRSRTWPKPTGPLMSFTDEQLAALEQYYVLQDKRTVRLASIDVTLDPEMLGRPYIERADVAVLQIIKDQLGKRPIYFSRTVGIYGDQFGLTSRLEGQGFGRALRERELQASDSIKAVASLGWVNLTRSRALLFDVYHAESAGRPRPRGWVDEPSVGILTTYGIIYYALAQELQATDPALAARAQDIAQAVFRNTRVNFQPLPERSAAPPPSLIPR